MCISNMDKKLLVYWCVYIDCMDKYVIYAKTVKDSQCFRYFDIFNYHIPQKDMDI